MFKRVTGTKDILPQESAGWQELEQTSRNIFSIYNYSEIRPPIIEDAGLFNRSLGEFTEIVQKQMFLIRRDEDIYCLRPEGTASIIRAYLENNLHKTQGFLKLYYIGPMFRAERPQKGRLRQFHHIGAEAIGSSGPEVDIEIISLANKLLNAYSIKGYKIRLNSLGCLGDKKGLASLLRKELEPKLDSLCPDCKTRFNQNVMRILDCKNDACRKAVAGLKLDDHHLCQDCRTHFNAVKDGLDALKIDYSADPLLVRGLDYYTRTVFEISHPDLGAQDALGAGGRYDNLVAELEGPQMGAIGFAFGVERLLLAKGEPAGGREKSKLVYVVTLGDQAKPQGLKLLDRLRQAGIKSDTDYEAKSLKSAMRSANGSGATHVLILGENELKNKTVMLKDMAKGEQKEVALSEIVKELTH